MQKKILYAIIETNGRISVIPKSANAPATAEDVKATNPEAKIPSIIVSDGQLMPTQMKEVNVNTEKLEKILSYLNVKSVKDLIILSLDNDGKLFYQTKNNNCRTIQDINKEISL